jgi:hypothetical protein
LLAVVRIVRGVGPAVVSTEDAVIDEALEDALGRFV